MTISRRAEGGADGDGDGLVDPRARGDAADGEAGAGAPLARADQRTLLRLAGAEASSVEEGVDAVDLVRWGFQRIAGKTQAPQTDG